MWIALTAPAMVLGVLLLMPGLERWAVKPRPATPLDHQAHQHHEGEPDH